MVTVSLLSPQTHLMVIFLALNAYLQWTYMEVGRVLHRLLGQWPKSYCSREGYVEPVRLKHPAKVKQISKTISNPRKNPNEQQ